MTSPSLLSPIRGVSSSQVIHSGAGGTAGRLGFLPDARAKLSAGKTTGGGEEGRGSSGQ